MVEVALHKRKGRRDELDRPRHPGARSRSPDLERVRHVAGLDTATFGYVAMFSALIVYLSGGMVGSYKGRRDALVRDMLIWLALGLGIIILYIFAQRRGFSF